MTAFVMLHTLAWFALAAFVTRDIWRDWRILPGERINAVLFGALPWLPAAWGAWLLIRA